ncbi:cell division protein [Erythrobacter sp. SN021]|uniref:cell division protein FtsX n=1 Tax=Erythrobacter sp. SN021 TaxID=2912574 RepID=UPI001F378C80|nr:cell division protein [Erythrobacter sp. SN021]MCF8883284.1 cell division protein [Erythrobacter sp. SN021]
MKKPPVVTRAVERGLSPFRGRRAAHLLPQARLGGPMPWVIAIMVALVVLAAGGGLALGNLADRARGELAGSATVQIVEADPALRAQQAQAAAAILAQDSAVASLSVVPQETVAQLLEPWLGTDDPEQTVPLPALIDMRLRDGADAATLDRLRSLLVDQAPSARIDTQAQWLAPVLSALSALGWMALGLIALLAFTGAAAVWLAARNALGANRETIEIVHLLGGNDDQIARIFQRSIFADALVGGVLGLVVGAMAVWLMGAQFAALDSGLVSGGGLETSDWLVLALVPVGAVVLAVYTARLTVLASLRKML